MKSVIGLSILTFALFFAVGADDAWAGLESFNILDNVVRRYGSASSGWAAIITERASWLFWTLVAISMVWTFGMMALRKADLQEFFAELLRFIVFTGFFWWLLSNGPRFARDIIESLQTLAGLASGQPGALGPSGVIDVGFEIFFQAARGTSGWRPVDSAVGLIAAGAILVVLALVSINMLLLLVSAWILMYAGVFYLGFGGSRWTSDMAIAYYKTVLSVGVQLMVMTLIVGIGQTFLSDYYANMSSGILLSELAVMLIVSITLLVLANKVPQMIGQVAFGGGTGGGVGGFGGGTALAAAGLAGAAVVSGGTALAHGATQVAGGFEAIKSACKMATGGGTAGSSTAPAGGGPGSGVKSQETGPSGGSSRGARGLALATTANLAKGASMLAKSKYHDAVKNTVGGRIAQQLESAANQRSESNTSDDNSFDPEKEIEQFSQGGKTT